MSSATTLKHKQYIRQFSGRWLVIRFWITAAALLILLSELRIENTTAIFVVRFQRYSATLLGVIVAAREGEGLVGAPSSINYK